MGQLAYTTMPGKPAYTTLLPPAFKQTSRFSNKVEIYANYMVTILLAENIVYHNGKC